MSELHSKPWEDFTQVINRTCSGLPTLTTICSALERDEPRRLTLLSLPLLLLGSGAAELETGLFPLPVNPPKLELEELAASEDAKGGPIAKDEADCFLRLGMFIEDDIANYAL